MNTLNAKFKFGRFLALAAVVALSVSSCNLIPDEDDITPDTQQAPEPPVPTFADGDGALTAVKTVTFQEVPTVPGVPNTGPIEIELGLGVAVFFNNGNTSSFTQAGTVTLEGEGLTLQDNNSYVFMPSQSNPTGIDLPTNPEWNVSGAGNVGAFTHQTSIGFPSVGEVTSAETVTRGSAYTLTIQNVSNADSVIFMCGGVLHTRAGNVTSHTFTADETNSMSAGPSYVQAAAYKIEEATVGGGDYWFVNERVVTQSVTIE